MLFVVFFKSNNNKQLLITFLVTDESSTTQLMSEDDFKVFTSPGYPNYYPQNTNVTFIIYSPEGTIIKLVLVGFYLCGDPIDIYDGKS